MSCDWEDMSRERRLSKVTAVDNRYEELDRLLDSGAQGSEI